MSSLYVNYTEFDAEKLFASTPETKQIPGQSSTYQQLPLLYNYGTNEEPLMDALYLEGPKLKSTQGISAKMFNGKEVHSIGVRFPEADPEALAFLQALGQLYVRTAQLLMHNKQQGLVKIDINQQTLPGLYKDPVYRPKDPLTGEILPGRTASIYHKLNATNYGRTLFTDLQGEKIEWSLLENAEIEFIYLVHISSIYIGGGKASLQMKMESAVVLSVVGAGSVTRQGSTIEAVVAQDPGLRDKVKEQIAKLTMDRKGGSPNGVADGSLSTPSDGGDKQQGAVGLGNMLATPSTPNMMSPPGQSMKTPSYGYGAPTPSNGRPAMTPINVKTSPTIASFTPPTV